MAEFSELRRRLEAEKEQLLQKLAEAQASQQITERRGGGSLGKRGEEAIEVWELEKRLSLEKRLRKSLEEIEHALQKYEAGTRRSEASPGEGKIRGGAQCPGQHPLEC